MWCIFWYAFFMKAIGICSKATLYKLESRFFLKYYVIVFYLLFKVAWSKRTSFSCVLAY